MAQTDSLRRNRIALISATDATLWLGSTWMLNEVWYKDYPTSAFHLFNDATNWHYMDKCGHSYTAYQLSGLQYAAWRSSGINPRKAAWIAGGISWGYQLTVEVLDGFSSEWGFSLADVTANTIGSGLFVGQQLAWNEQRIRLKFGYRASPYAALRPKVLGSGFTERLLKDYNAQSYWLCVSPQSFFPDSGFPPWLQLAVGYSADQMLRGDSDVYTVDGFTYHARPELAFSLDVDWNRLPVRRKWVKAVLRPLNAVKIPLPAVFWRDGVCYAGFF